MNLRSRRAQIFLGLIISGLSFYLVLRQVELPQVLAAFAWANYYLVGVAVAMQLVALWAIAGRWQRLFLTAPGLLNLLRVLLIAQLANVVLPVRLGVLIRAYLVGRSERISKALVLSTAFLEKIFDSLVFVLLFVTVLPFVAPGWFRWSALPMSSGLFFTLFPFLILLTFRRRWLIRFVRASVQYFPWTHRFALSQRFEAVIEGLSPLQGMRRIFEIWGWTLLITILGALVNAVVMRACDVQVPIVAAFFLLAVLQMGARIPAPLGGIGIFQYLCVEALSFFGVNANLALSFGFMLHFVVFVPGALLGTLSLYQIHESLPALKKVAEEGS